MPLAGAASPSAISHSRILAPNGGPLPRSKLAKLSAAKRITDRAPRLEATETLPPWGGSKTRRNGTPPIKRFRRYGRRKANAHRRVSTTISTTTSKVCTVLYNQLNFAVLVLLGSLHTYYYYLSTAVTCVVPHARCCRRRRYQRAGWCRRSRTERKRSQPAQQASLATPQDVECE